MPDLVSQKSGQACHVCALHWDFAGGTYARYDKLIFQHLLGLYCPVSVEIYSHSDLCTAEDNP